MKPAYRLSGVRHKGGVNLIQAPMRNVGNCRPDVKGEAQVEAHKGESTEAGHSGGTTRSSEKVP